MAAAHGCHAAMETADEVDRLRLNWSMDLAFGEGWPRDLLPRRMHSLVVLGMLVGRHQEDTRRQTKMGIANGLIREEIGTEVAQ